MKVLSSILFLVVLLSLTLAKPGVYKENHDGQKTYNNALLKYLLRQLNGTNSIIIICSIIIIMTTKVKIRGKFWVALSTGPFHALLFEKLMDRKWSYRASMHGHGEDC